MFKQVSLSNTKFLLTYLAWWLFWFVVQACLLFYIGQSIKFSIVDAAIFNLLLAIAGLSLITAFKNYRPGNITRFYCVLFGVALTGVVLVVFRFINFNLFSNEEIYLSFISQTTPVRFVFALLMITAMNLVSWFWFGQIEKENELSRENNATDLLKKAELANLKQQMQPHFLFNSLNSINALIGTDPKKARQMIQQLSDFLRGTLKKDEQQLVKLEDEISQLNLYLEIEKVRFGYRLETEVNVSEGSNSAMIPALLLQPIVENAIKFGLYDTTENIIIKLSAETQDNYLFFQVENPYDPATAGSSIGTGFGLHSIKRRLYLLFGRNDLLVTKAENNIFITQVKIPQQHV